MENILKKIDLIALDGPAGSGKSTIAKLLASQNGFYHLDTGKWYRALTSLCLANNITPNSNKIDLYLHKLQGLDESVIPGDIRIPEITGQIGKYSKKQHIRDFLNNQFKKKVYLNSSQNIASVAEGRDIATKVFPDALLKIVLTADISTRALRRYKQMHNGEIPKSKGDEQILEKIKQDIIKRDEQDLKVNNFLKKKKDIFYIDTSEKSIQEIISQITDLYFAQKEKYKLKTFKKIKKIPEIAVFGRSNVGKSTLINAVLNKNAAITKDEQGVTRDKVKYNVQWLNNAGVPKDFYLVDTGGYVAGGKNIDKDVSDIALNAALDADAVLFVVDAKVGCLEADRKLAKTLQKNKKDVILVANKVDNQSDKANIYEFYALGFGEPFEISAAHRNNISDLLDTVLEKFIKDKYFISQDENIPRICLVGKPNAGKSTLINSLLGKNISLTSDIRGTTRDPLDAAVNLGGSDFIFVDTAGITQKQKFLSGVEYYSFERTKRAIERSDIACVIFDSKDGIKDIDMKILKYVINQGKTPILLFNKWDALDDYEKEVLKYDIEQKLNFAAWALRINISAKSKWHIARIRQAVLEVYSEITYRVSTSKLNAFFYDIYSAKPHPLRGGRQPRVLYATQADIKPPTFVLFANLELDETYKRYLIRKLRETFNFRSCNIVLNMKIKEKREFA